MKEELLYDLEENIENCNIILAHVKEGKKEETLLEHSQKTIEYFNKLCKIKGIDSVIDGLISQLKCEDKSREEKFLDKEQFKLVKRMFINAIYLHDIGKINPTFQINKLNNNEVKKYITEDINDTNHSLLSSLIYIDIFNQEIQQIQNKRLRRFVEYLMYSFSFIISRHHTYLKTINDFIDELEYLHKRVTKRSDYLVFYKSSSIHELDFEKSNFRRRDKVYSKNYYQYFEVYILTKLLFSLIVTCDFYATYDYMHHSIDDFGIIKDIDKLISIYSNSKIYKGIEKYKEFKEQQTDVNPYGENSINTLRTEMFLEAEENLLNNMDKDIFYLEAPTGSGKTNTSINLALKLIQNKPDINKIFYIFPFNTLVEQTKNTFDELFGKNSEFEIAVNNSITPINTEEEKAKEEAINKIDYDKCLLNRQFLHYPIVLTTHVNFFNYLFGTGREINFPLTHLCNSVIIIDEVQSYKNKIWKEIIMFLKRYSKYLNMKIIIMSATLPKLDRLLDKVDEDSFGDLIVNKDNYYNSTFFKNRVKLNFDLLNDDRYKNGINLEELAKEVEKVWKERRTGRFLIEFIKKTTAREFYDLIKDRNPEKIIFELTGDDNRITRKRILNQLKQEDSNGEFILKDVLVVATQVIEAGVDIDMDLGFKDISLLDNEEQFLGRINRSCNKENCKAYFFNLDNAKQVYKEDFRLEKDLLDIKYREYLLQKDFNEFYELCFSRIESNKNELNENNIENLENDIKRLDYNAIENKMKLIDEQNYQIYLANSIYDEENSEIIDGRDIWNKYKELVQDDTIDYAEKKVKLSKLYEKMSYFIYNMRTKPMHHDEYFGTIFYVKEGERFIKDGKFDRKKYKEETEGLFL